MNNINAQLTLTIEGKLHESHGDEYLSIPVPVIAQSISGLYSGLIISWFTKFQSFDACQFATYINRNISSLLLEAYK